MCLIVTFDVFILDLYLFSDSLLDLCLCDLCYMNIYNIVFFFLLLLDFDLSDTQRKHALAIERFAPRLAALRIELCPCHMTESYFWKVYFVLLHSRLHKHDAEILSTPQVIFF